MIRYNCLLGYVVVLLACFNNIVHSVLPREVRYDLSCVEEITTYTVSLSDKKDQLIFENPKIPTDILIFKLDEIIIAPNNPIGRTVEFSLDEPADPDIFYAVVFHRSNQAERFIDYKVARDDAFVSGSATRISAATSTNVVPRIICSRDEDGKKYFEVVIKSNPAFNFDFDFREVDITNHSKSRNRNNELVEIKHRCLSKLYKLQFESVDVKGEFLSFFQSWISIRGSNP